MESKEDVCSPSPNSRNKGKINVPVSDRPQHSVQCVVSTLKHKVSDSKTDETLPKKCRFTHTGKFTVDFGNYAPQYQVNCTVTSGEYNSKPVENFGPSCSTSELIDNHSAIVNEGETNINYIDLTTCEDVNISLNDVNPIFQSITYGVSNADNLNSLPTCFSNLRPETKDLEKPPYFPFLVEIFPDDDETILLRLCTGHQDLNIAVQEVLSFHAKESTSTAQTAVNNYAEVQSVDNSNHSNDNKELIYDKQLEILKEILVHADPEYLENIFKNKLFGDQNLISDFISEALDKRNFPTIKESQDKLKYQDLCTLYTTNYNIEKFVAEFPDPDNYFTRRSDETSYKSFALDYLKQNYNKISVKCIKEVMEKNENNLTNSFLKLAQLPPNLVKRRNFKSGLVYTVDFLKEVCFIEHRNEILNFIKQKQDEKLDTFFKAKQFENLFECNCCYNDEVVMDDIITCPEGHIFCKTCLKKGVETKVGEGQYKFPCFVECDSEFTLKSIESVLNAQLFSKITVQQQLEEIKAANIPDVEDCPFCEYMGIPILESIVFTCLNPNCGKESCRKCHEESHIPLRCDEVEKQDEIKLRTQIEDCMTKAMIRKCYKCHKEFIKESGCNKIQCSCGALQCYICRQPINNYKHFNPNGGLEYHKCPLFSTDDALHVEPVLLAAKAAKETLNPEDVLTHDPTKILPKISGKPV